MGGSTEARDDQEEALAEELVAEALEPYARLVTADVLGEIRHCLLDKLLVHPDGRRMLRRAMPDPVVGSSGEVARGNSAEAERRRAKRKGQS